MRMKREDMVGVYRGRGDEVIDATGKVIQSASSSNAQIMYTADGYIGVVSTPGGRKPLANSGGRTDLGGATPEELVEATRNVTCYAGHFEVKGDEVHHHIEMALNPSLIGTTLIRHVHFDGPNLTLSARPDAQGNVRRILWRRVEGR
jgi:Lipocalin-like domain